MKYQVVTPNEIMMNAYQNIIYGKPDCWDVRSEHDTLADAEKAAKKIRGRVAIRLSDDVSPHNMISDEYRIDPKREPELAARMSQPLRKGTKMIVNGLEIIKKEDAWHIITPSGHDVFHMKTQEGAIRIAKELIYRTSPFATPRRNHCEKRMK